MKLRILEIIIFMIISQINYHTVYSDINKTISEYYMIGKNMSGSFAVLPAFLLNHRTIDEEQSENSLRKLLSK